MNFGLGLVLSFTDNATAGINNAVNSLDRLTQKAENANASLDQIASLSALSVVSGQIGNAFTSMGSTIISSLGQVIGKVNSTGQTLMYAENQLNALYKDSGKTGKEVIGQIQEYAETSMFEFENLIPAVTSLKSVGIEAFDSITSSMGNSKNNLLDYASALASFAPQMKNAYGTGINAAIGAMREYIAEGNAMSLKRGAGLDITGILGEDKGATIEERTRQVADLIEKLGMLDMVDVMKNSPMTKLSNMGDTLFKFTGMVSNSGVYDAINGLIDIFADFVSSIEDSRLESMAKTVGSALSSLIKPLEWVSKKIVALADGLLNLVENNPELVKLITIGVAVTGVLLLISGIALKVTSALSGLSLMLLVTGNSFKSIGTLMKTGILKILGTLIPFIATIALMRIAWKNDLAGIRTNVTYFVSSLVNSFRTASSAVRGSIGDLKMTIHELNNRNDFFSNLTLGIMKVMMVFQALSDAWGDYTLSEENFQKAKDLGILPLIENILDLKYKFDFFKQGFKDGWDEIGEKVSNIVESLTSKLDGTFLGDMLEGITNFLDRLASGDTQAWYDFGQSFADFTAKALAFAIAVKVIGTAFNIFKTVGTIIGGIFKAFFEVKTLLGGGMLAPVTKLGKAVLKIGTSFSKIIGGITKVFGVIKGVVMGVVGFISTITGLPAVVVGAIMVAIVAIVALVIKYRDQIFNALKAVGTWIYENIIAPVVNFFTTYIFPIISKVVEIVMKIVEIITTLFSVFINWIKTSFIDPIAQWFKGLWEGIVNGVSSFIEGVKAFFSPIVEWIKTNIIDPIAEFFKGLWEGIEFAFGVVADTITGVLKGAVNMVLQFICGLINGVIWALNGAIDLINMIPGVSITKIEKLEVPELAQGGIVSKPTHAIIGEAGTEAVMPLENNTAWIGRLAQMISSEMHSITPTSTSHMTPSNQGSSQGYMTTNNNNSQVIHGSTDNSVVFNQGAIQVTVQNATEEEAMRLARMVMELIKRQRQLDAMLHYS